MSETVHHRHHVVVIGSGFGGLFAAKRLSKAKVDVTLISRTTHHLFQPLLYQVATGILSEGEIAPSTREILSKRKNVKVLLGEVTDIDVATHTVTSEVAGHSTVTGYDSVIVAAGATTSYFGNDEFEANAPGLKSIDDALDVRARILSAFEFAELETDDTTRDGWLTFAVVGAGPTGVELAGQIAELSHRTLRHDFRSIDPKKVRIVLVDALGMVLGSFGTKLSSGAVNQLEHLGVEVWLDEKVIGVDHTGLTVEDKSGVRTRIPARTTIWAAGVKASGLTTTLSDQTGAPTDRSGRISVQGDCTLPGHPEVYVVGDMMSLKDYPGVAQVAMQQAKYCADAIRRRIDGKSAQKPFEYFDKGSMATISRFKAVANVGPLRFGGFIAWMLWLVIHIFYLVGFKNRITTVLHWAVSFLGRGRAQRTITGEQIGRRSRDAGLPVARSADEPEPVATESGHTSEHEPSQPRSATGGSTPTTGTAHVKAG